MSANPTLTPQQILFTDLRGTAKSLEDIIAEGLDEDYSSRLPALYQLLSGGTPQHQFYACTMLVGWGDAVGYETLLRWAENPAQLPWRVSSSAPNAGPPQPVSLDCFFDVDNAFERLTMALQTSSLLNENRPTLFPAQQRVVRALLRIYASESFARALGDLLSADRPLCEACLPDIDQALAASFARLEKKPPPFDLGSQIAFLLAPFARHRDVAAAEYATQLLAQFPPGHRSVYELAHALRMGSGAATQAILEELKGLPYERIRKDAEESMRIRERRRELGLIVE